MGVFGSESWSPAPHFTSAMPIIMDESEIIGKTNTQTHAKIASASCTLHFQLWLLQVLGNMCFLSADGNFETYCIFTSKLLPTRLENRIWRLMPLKSPVIGWCLQTCSGHAIRVKKARKMRMRDREFCAKNFALSVRGTLERVVLEGQI